MKKIAIALLTGLLLFSCSGIKVITDLDRTADFSKYKSLEFYGWVDKSDEIMNRFDRERIEQAFADEFLSRGIEIVEEGKGDMVVSLYIVTEEKTQTTASTTSMGGMYGGYGGYYGYGPGWGWGGGHSHTTFNEYNYTVGTLLVSVYDKAEEKLIWESAGSGEIREDPEKRAQNIPKAVAMIMKDYPVKPLQ